MRGINYQQSNAVHNADQLREVESSSVRGSEWTYNGLRGTTYVSI